MSASKAVCCPICVEIDFSAMFISEIPATLENCAICATIAWLSTGLNGSCSFSCVVISRRKSVWPNFFSAMSFDNTGRFFELTGFMLVMV